MTRQLPGIAGLYALVGMLLGPVLVEADDALRFERVVIDDNFPGGYQVEVADVDGDGKPDLVALGGSTVAWYQNPSWTKRVITGPDRAPDVISSATADLDGDGKAEVAIAYDFEMNNPKRGKLGLAVQGANREDPWEFRPVADVPSIHRVRWADFDGDRRLDLVVAPIFGPQAKPPEFNQQAAALQVVRGLDARRPSFRPEFLGSFDVLHAIEVTDLLGDGRPRLLTASRAGTGMIYWGKLFTTESDPAWQSGRIFTVAARPEFGLGAPAFPGSPPGAAAASEVRAGRTADGRCLLATIEPWHGSMVVIYAAAYRDQPEFEGGRILEVFSERTVLDDTLDQGHALWLADIDGDGDDEVFAGHRGKDHRVSVYDFNGKSWDRTVIDRDIAAQDLRGGDLDGDGTPEVVAIGGATHNVVLYRVVRDANGSNPPRATTTGEDS